MAALTPEQQKKQEQYRDARFLNKYDDIWQSVGKCVFCDLNEKYIFFEENGVVMTISLFAYIDGHFMIIPRRHIKSTKELSQLEWETIRKFTYIAKKLIKDVHGIKGMQFVEKDGADAQSTVEHIHFHCVPFDKPDLNTWNMRKLERTPLENVSLYKHARKDILKHDRKFMEKYQNFTALPVICDLLIVNQKSEILLQERSDDAKLSPDYLTFPGGGVDNYNGTLEDELIREVREETGLELRTNQFHLLTSRLSSHTIVRTSKALNARYSQPMRCLWNTYVLEDFDMSLQLSPGDDCKELIWMPIKEASNHERLSPGLKAAIQVYLEQLA